MTKIYRKSMAAAAIAALFSMPALAQSESPMEQLREEHPAAAPQNQSEMNSTGSQSATTQYSTSQTQSGGALLSMTPHQLEGMEVVDTGGEKIGRVDSIVQSRSDNQAYAVIAGGGFVGVGDKEIVVPLSELSQSGDQLHVSATADDLAQKPEYKSDDYVAVSPEDRPISEFSAFETDQGQGMTQRSTTESPTEGGRVHKSPTGKVLDPADPRQSSDISPDRSDLPPSNQQ